VLATCRVFWYWYEYFLFLAFLFCTCCFLNRQLDSSVFVNQSLLEFPSFQIALVCLLCCCMIRLESSAKTSLSSMIRCSCSSTIGHKSLRRQFSHCYIPGHTSPQLITLVCLIYPRWHWGNYALGLHPQHCPGQFTQICLPICISPECALCPIHICLSPLMVFTPTMPPKLSKHPAQDKNQK